MKKFILAKASAINGVKIIKYAFGLYWIAIVVFLFMKRHENEGALSLISAICFLVVEYFVSSARIWRARLNRTVLKRRAYMLQANIWLGTLILYVLFFLFLWLCWKLVPIFDQTMAKRDALCVLFLSGMAYILFAGLGLKKTARPLAG